MKISLDDLKLTIQDIVTKKRRCEEALKSPTVSERIKVRVLQPEYLILTLALEGATALAKTLPPSLTEKHVSFVTPPAPTADHQTD